MAEPTAEEKHKASQRRELIIVGLVFAGIGLVVLWMIYGKHLMLLHGTKKEITDRIRVNINRDYAFGKMVLVERTNSGIRFTRRVPGVNPSSAEEWEKDPKQYDDSILAVIPPGTHFRVKRLIQTEDAWSGKGDIVYLQLRSGPHKGRTYPMSGSAVFTGGYKFKDWIEKPDSTK